MGQPAALEYSARPPPRVSGYPVVGALPGLIKGQFDFLESARRRYGDVYELDLGFTQATVLCHPRHAQHILLDNARNYTKGGPLWDSIRTFIGNGLPVSEGEFWKRQRRIILARGAQRYQASAVPGREARLHLGTTLRAKDGVWVSLAARA